MSQYRFEDVVPHTAPMVLVDEIDRWDDNSLQASLTIRADAPFADVQGVPTWVGIEYMAQTVGAFGGVQARENQQPIKIGFLVGSRRYTCSRPYFPIGSKLTVTVTEELRGENGLSVFECVISGDDIEAQARLNVFQPDDPESFLAGENN